MAEIKHYLDAIMEAEYGEQVRGSIHDAIKTINDEVIEFTEEGLGIKEITKGTPTDMNGLIMGSNGMLQEVYEKIDPSYIPAGGIILDGDITGGGTYIAGQGNAISTYINWNAVGEIPIHLIPKGALEKPKYIYDETEMLSLTINDVQNGDTVVLTKYDPAHMYLVVREDLLGTMQAFEQYKGGAASSVSWQNVTGKPNLVFSVNEKTPDKTGNIDLPEIFDLESAIKILFSEDISWSKVQKVVRAGLGPKLFPVWNEFAIHNSDENTDIIWRVVGHDHHKAANSSLEHTMTLEMKYVYSTSAGTQKDVIFDAVEALYYAESGLEAGTYHFTVTNQAWYTEDNGKTYQFTLTQAVPAGGQIVLDATYNTALEGRTVKIYASSSSTAVIETTAITAGNSGISLGTTDGTLGMNHMHRALLGSNNYAQSAINQWLNSSAGAGSVWTPKTVFDRPPSWANTYHGFMHGLPEDFLAVVQPAIIPCRTNSIYEVNSLDGTEFAADQTYELTRKFFLLSRPEIYGTWDSASIKDGELLEYYDGLTDTERIKRDVSDSARGAWLRSPTPTYASYARIVHTNGTVTSIFAGLASGAAAACIIA